MPAALQPLLADKIRELQRTALVAIVSKHCINKPLTRVSQSA